MHTIGRHTPPALTVFTMLSYCIHYVVWLTDSFTFILMFHLYDSPFPCFFLFGLSVVNGAPISPLLPFVPFSPAPRGLNDKGSMEKAV